MVKARKTTRTTRTTRKLVVKRQCRVVWDVHIDTCAAYHTRTERLKMNDEKREKIRRRKKKNSIDGSRAGRKQGAAGGP